MHINGPLHKKCTTGGRQINLTLEKCLGPEKMRSWIGKDLHQIIASVFLVGIPQSKSTEDSSLCC